MPLGQAGPQFIELRPSVGDGGIEALDPVFLPHDLLDERHRAEVMLAGVIGGNLGLRQQCADAGQTFIGLGHIVDHVGPRTVGIRARYLFNSANSLAAAGGDRLEASHA